MNRRAWPATVHGAVESDTTEQLSLSLSLTHTHRPRNFLAFDCGIHSLLCSFSECRILCILASMEDTMEYEALVL